MEFQDSPADPAEYLPPQDSVWAATVDGGRFLVAVVPVTGNQEVATLTVQVTETGEVLLHEDVSLMYGAKFGPDVSDVASWQERSVGVIDEWLVQRGEEPPGEEPQ